MQDPAEMKASTSAHRHRNLLVIAAVAVCVLIAGVIVDRVRAGGANSDATGTTEHAAYAAVASATRETIANPFSITGQFLPYQNVELHAKVAGYIKKIYVDIGDRVHTGEVLAVLEIPELVAQIDEAKAGVHHAEEEIQQAKSEVLRAEADSVALHSNAARLVSTNKAQPGLIAQQELDDATSKDRASAARVDAAKSAQSAAQQQLAVAQATLQHYTALYGYANITAPYDGVVTWRFSDTGSLVQAGTSETSGLPVVTVAQINLLRLRIPAPESVAAKVRIGDTVDVEVQATGEHFKGTVTRFTNALDPTTRTEQVEIDVPNSDYHLQPGMYANVTLMTSSKSNALTVPVEAIQRTGDKTYVLAVNSQNQVERRQIQTGIQDSNKVEVVSGVAGGERVIVGNLGSYRSGETVQPRATSFDSQPKDTE
jgi:RND family efflux transporter MFP subunit